MAIFTQTIHRHMQERENQSPPDGAGDHGDLAQAVRLVRLLRQLGLRE